MRRSDVGARDESHWKTQRIRMVREQIEARGVRNSNVLDALRVVPRHEFVPDEYRDASYADSPLPIGSGQTISQPYIVALMSELTSADQGSRILEIGTGCGYQAAVLAAMGAEVFSIEIVPVLAKAAADRLKRLGFSVHVRCGDGHEGWPDAAPFDAIVVTAAPAEIPGPLIEQLADGGRMVIPVGSGDQDLELVTKEGATVRRQTVIPVRFVPMTGGPRKKS